MTLVLSLPRADGSLTPYRVGPPAPARPAGGPSRSRRAFAAAHVVCDPLAARESNGGAAVDWEATLAYRHYLWSLGLGVAEAMDTAQRGMQLDWPTAQELITRSVSAARSVNGVIACGAGTDHLRPSPEVRLAQVMAAYEDQCSVVEAAGGRIILMASRALAACARDAEDYATVYRHVLSQVAEPVILHWLGDMFDPALAEYWGSTDVDAAMEVCLAVMSENRSKVDGIKISLLDKDREIAMRRRLPAGVRMYTGDDFHYPELIRGDGEGHSDALLGIFDPIAPVAAAALAALDDQDVDAFSALLDPTVPLARHIFRAPTQFYKTGVVFMAYLNGHQRHFRMLGGLESARSVVHLAELFVLADRACLLNEPEEAVVRMRRVLAVAGIV